MPTPKSPALRYCGRTFSPVELDSIRNLIASNDEMKRAELSRQVCQLLNWLKPDGGLKDMSCRVAMLKMHRAGLIKLPPPRWGNGNGRRRPKLTSASEAQEIISVSAGCLGDLKFLQVESRKDSSLWNELIERHHYLGYDALPGAQIRYLVFSGSRLLAAMGFGASAWKVADRDGFIGWSAEQRAGNLHLIVNNARFLILPWIRCPNLASRLLSLAARRIGDDWEKRYSYRPVLLETFVDRERFSGTCYRAANWIRVGQTQGRGKMDRYKKFPLPVKHIFVYPLRRNFRRLLCAPT